jgi:hypothetical protein
MKRSLSVFLAVVLLTAALSVPTVAYDNSIDASHQISGYSIGIVPRGSGRVEVTVNITGTHRQMTTIGFPSITIYERANSNSPWQIVRTSGPHYNPNVPAGSHSHVVTYQGVAGRQYYAHATFLARDAQGSDSRQATSPWITAT